MVLITQELFDNMSCDAACKNTATTATGVEIGNKEPCVLIVFGESDINAALYHLTKSLNAPFEPRAIATVVVQESIKQDFVEKLQLQLKSYSSKGTKNNEHFAKALETSIKLNAKLVTAGKQEKNVYQPTLVCDFTHEQLGASAPSGIVTLHTFRTAKEAITLVNKESLKFINVSIWHENHSYAYELVAALKSNHFFINCYQVPLQVLEESIKQGQSYVNIINNYHYETLQHDGMQKSIVFPIGSIFAN